MKHHPKGHLPRVLLTSAMVCAVVAIGACGGGSGGDAVPAPAPAPVLAPPLVWSPAQLLETVNAIGPLPAFDPAAVPPVARNPINMGDAEAPSVGFDASGQALAVWRQSDGVRYNLWANRYVPGAGWGTAAPIEGGGGSMIGFPRLMVQPSGVATVWWVAGRASLSARYLPGSGWGAAKTVNFYPVSRVASPNDFSGPTPDMDLLDTVSPAVVAGAEGGFTAVWDEFEPDGRATSSANASGNYSVWGNQTFADGSWGTPVRLKTPVRGLRSTSVGLPNARLAGFAQGPRFGADAAGNTLALWLDNDIDVAGQKLLFARRVAGVWQPAGLIPGDDLPSRQDSYDIAMDASGQGMAVWTRPPGVFAKRYTAATGWETQTVAIQAARSGANPGPLQVVADGAGNMLALWSGPLGLWANRFVPGTGWGTAVQVHSTSSQIPRFHVAGNAKGNAVVVWHEEARVGNVSTVSLWASYFAADTCWRAATALSRDGTPSGNPNLQAAIDASGNATAVWDGFDGTRVNIMTSAYRR